MLLSVLPLIVLHDACLLTVAAAPSVKSGPQHHRPLAIVNVPPFHSEVLSGAMEAVRPMADRTAVYMNRHVYTGRDGLRPLVASYPGLLMPLPYQQGERAKPVPHHKVVFFISPEVSLGYTRWFINASRPDTVVLMVHNADDPRVPKLLELHPRARLVALSPHVAAALRQRGFQADWWLAAWDAQGAVPAGRLDSRRRSYGSLWSDLEVAANSSMPSRRSKTGSRSALVTTSDVPWLKILGRPVKGEEGFLLPRAVRPYVKLYPDARYSRFFGHIRCSVALLTLFADEAYYDTKFSSTVLASLSTGTPILADAPFLSAYSFLNASTTWALQPGEGLVRGMQRVAAEGWAQHAARRGALAALRRELNARAGAYLGALMEETDSRAD
ncbi:hypothetical protein HYH03_013649 [Edaphochlamys debaryana]|uniref:Uncharacterized protein n=1 Tax=Edaphochlamys debaryana TaxID=47281 RepID=A0A835XVX4_9CHLO|nr:hypothetical protein HYH03_013649 [Edaphochlamys debaryana]|eukprot:KAG2487805.1 hypothetical protein HYH03_013649 [Edaphochlamys debaryana]